MVWILFDNEFNLVKSSSGMVKIPNTPDTRQDIVKTDIIMERGGYFYAYLVNESSMNVYFDDFQVTHVTGKVLEENHYYPFGMLNAQLSTRPTEKPLNHYKYNGKEVQKELNLEWLDYGARFYDAQLGRWHSVDPLAEKYYSEAHYCYVDNNPLLHVDPQGKDILIFYEVETPNGIKYKSFVFNGENQASAPNNEFIKNFLSAYDYNIKNGGGNVMKEAATDKTLKILCMPGDETNYGYPLFGSEKDGVNKGTVIWNPNSGLETTDNKLLSPATLLEEEFDHAVDDAKNHPKHFARQGTDDPIYGNKEERRVAEGSVSETARKNGEAPINWIKPNHNGKPVIKKHWNYQK